MVDYQELSDEELVKKSLDDREVFYYLIKRYESKLMRYINRIASVTHEEAEDLLQEIFIKAYRHLNGFDQRLKFSSWVYRIAHNEVINFAKKRKRGTALIHASNNGDTDNMVLDNLAGEDDVHGNFVAMESREQVWQALMELPLKYREVLVLKFFENKSYREMSDILRKPEGTVATLVNRAKKKFLKIASKYQLEGILQ
ncbi:MAG: RNA polymerase sigma factor [Deltaproteobacteria bacterium]|nr:RNA polymerase sigma factor [Deltaproteobacteria bacterium]